MLSVIIPCYNCEAFVGRAINSVFNQTYKDVEILLVDNNSTDNTIGVLNHYRNSYPDKVKVFSEQKKGAPAARNKGLYEARGEWIQFLDADDELLPNKIQMQLNLANSQNADIVVGDSIFEYKEKGKTIRMLRRSDNDVWKGLIRSKLGITSSNLWRTQSLLSINGWDESLTSSQEYDLLFRLLKSSKKVIFDPGLNTIVYRMDNSISKSTGKERLVRIVQNRINLRLKIIAYLKLNNKLTSDINRASDTYIYNGLMEKAIEIPEFVNNFLQYNKLDIPLNIIVSANIRLAYRRSVIVIKKTLQL